MFSKPDKMTGLVLLCIAGFCTTQQQLLAASAEDDHNTLQVGNCNGKNGYPTIGAAIAAASSGDTVSVCPGFYPEQVVILKALTLTGTEAATRDQAVILPPTGVMSTIPRAVNYPNPGRPIAVQLLIQNAQDVHIRNLTIDGTNNRIPNGTDSTCRVPAQETPTFAGIYLANASATINNVATRNQIMSPAVNCHGAFGILAETSGALVNLTVTDSSVRAFETDGIVADDHGMTAKIIGNSVFGNPGTSINGIRLTFGATGEVSENLVVVGNPPLNGTSILCLPCHGAKISGNTIVDSDDGIVVVSADFFPGPFNGDSDETTVTSNQILAMNPAFPPDGAIYICSNHNKVSGNRIIGTTAGPAIMVDNTCAIALVTGNNNVVQDNTVNEACAGVMVNTGTTGNTIKDNEFSNVAVTTTTGAACARP